MKKNEKGVEKLMKQRIITASYCSGTIFTHCLFSVDFRLLLLTYFLATIGLYELLKMKKINYFFSPGLLSLIISLGILFPAAIS